jgi:hypothetical protein
MGYTRPREAKSIDDNSTAGSKRGQNSGLAHFGSRKTTRLGNWCGRVVDRIARCFHRQAADRWAGGPEPELEGATDSTNPTVLPNDSQVSGRGRGSVRDEEAPKISQGASETGGTAIGEDVPATTLKPHNFMKVLYSRARGKLGLDIVADRAIDIFTVPADEYDKWRSGKPFEGSSFLRRKNLHMVSNTGPELEGDWYLVLENVSDDPIDVDYEVFER